MYHKYRGRKAGVYVYIYTREYIYIYISVKQHYSTTYIETGVKQKKGVYTYIGVSIQE